MLGDNATDDWQVNLVELTMQQKDALSVLLTGRAENAFGELIKRMVRSKKLAFDMVCLKPAVGPANQRFTSTMNFKQELLSDIVYTYKEADEIRIYEDRPKQYALWQLSHPLLLTQLLVRKVSAISFLASTKPCGQAMDPFTVSQ